MAEVNLWMKKASQLGLTQTRTEGTCPGSGSEFTTKAARQQRDSAELVPSTCVVALGLVAARACVWVLV